jgi:hypothetical protein
VERPAALIAYDGLPISAGGAHTLRMRDRQAIWDRMRDFLASMTTCRDPDRVRLLLAEGTHIDAAFVARAEGAASRAFGTPRRRSSVAGAVEERELAWTLPPDRIDDALALIDELEPVPEHLGRGVLTLGIEALFFLRDPRSGETLPGQGAQQSRIYLRLSSRSTCAIFLSLPFPHATPGARAYIALLRDALPFRLSAAHWSRWQLNAQGTRYYKRRIRVDDD